MKGISTHRIHHKPFRKSLHLSYVPVSDRCSCQYAGPKPSTLAFLKQLSRCYTPVPGMPPGLGVIMIN